MIKQVIPAKETCDNGGRKAEHVDSIFLFADVSKFDDVSHSCTVKQNVFNQLSFAWQNLWEMFIFQ